MSDWLVLVEAYASAYKMDPNLCLALAQAESQLGKRKFRFGLHGRYYLPFGIYKGCKVPRANTPGGNTEAGIKALARHLRKCKGNLRAALHRYNTGDKGAKFDRYFRRIKNLTAQNKRNGVFE